MSFLKHFFKNKQGNIVIAQYPNTPLWLAIFLWFLLSLPFAQLETIQLISRWLLVPVLLYWSYLEIFFGESNFRKVLGIAVACYSLKNLLQLILYLF